MKIDKLNDSIHHAWKQKIDLLLTLKDLHDLIEQKPPTDTTELSKWKRNNRKSRAVMGLSLSDEHIKHDRHVETAKEMMTAVLNVFERHMLLNKLSARRKLNYLILHTHHGKWGENADLSEQGQEACCHTQVDECWDR